MLSTSIFRRALHAIATGRYVYDHATRRELTRVALWECSPRTSGHVATSFTTDHQLLQSFF